MFDARKLDKKIEIYSHGTAVDTVLGTDEQTDTLLCTVWASIQPRTGSMLKGREAGTMLSQTTHTIVARSRAVKAVTDDCYITWTDEFGGAHRFDIDYVLPPAGAAFTNIYCTEVIRHGD